MNEGDCKRRNVETRNTRDEIQLITIPVTPNGLRFRNFGQEHYKAGVHHFRFVDMHRFGENLSEAIDYVAVYRPNTTRMHTTTQRPSCQFRRRACRTQRDVGGASSFNYRPRFSTTSDAHVIAKFSSRVVISRYVSVQRFPNGTIEIKLQQIGTEQPRRF
jgi:hypothetical protein